MKYVIILGDGMADEPVTSLNGQTPLQYAQTPMMDELATVSEVGLVQTIPSGMSPGSDTANLSVLGYDPQIYYTGRSPLEALSIGVDMREEDIAFRCNLVTVSNEENFEEKRMIDHSSSEISTEDASILLQDLKESLENEVYKFYRGTSYRHLLVWEGGKVLPLTPPHDILEKSIGRYLPEDPVLLYMQKKSYEILKEHPINLEREKKGLNPANCCWFWGAGTKPTLTSFEEVHQKRGVMISAVDLLKGIAVGAGMDNIEVEGATGGLHTNYEGKAMAAVENLLHKDYDFAYIHIEAPDEMGHQGSVEHKVEAIEYLDHRVVRLVKEALDQSEEAYRLLILPDHPTPLYLRTHTSNPVPYLLYDSRKKVSNPFLYNEKEAQESKQFINQGYLAICRLFEEEPSSIINEK